MADNYTSVPDALQGILARKRAEQHQNLVDQLQAANVQSEIQNRAEQTAASRELRKATADEREANARLRQDKIDSHNRFRTQFAAFQKSPEFQQLPAHFRNAVNLGGMSDDDDILKNLISSYTAGQKYENPGHAYAIDPTTKRMVDAASGANVAPGTTLGPNDKVVELSRPQRDPADHWIDDGPEEDEQGRKTGNRLEHNGLTGEYRVVKGIRIGAKGPGKTPIPISAAEASKLATLRGKATPKSNSLMGFSWSSKPNDQDVAAYNQMLETTLSKYPTSPDVRDTVRDVLAHEKDDTPNDEIIKRHSSVFNPQELEQFSDLLHIVRGS